MVIHFEELWEQCENVQKEASADITASAIIEELILKLNLYKVLDAKSEIPPTELKKIRARVLGEILLTMTSLSVKDNVDVYEALSMALQYRRLEQYQKKQD
jgi:hypothetical protein